MGMGVYVRMYSTTKLVTSMYMDLFRKQTLSEKSYLTGRWMCYLVRLNFFS